jgi:hypothetical protein
LRQKLEEYFREYDGDPLPAGKTAFNVERLRSESEQAIDRLVEDSKKNDDGTSAKL